MCTILGEVKSKHLFTNADKIQFVQKQLQAKYIKSKQISKVGEDQKTFISTFALLLTAINNFISEQVTNC